MGMQMCRKAVQVFQKSQTGTPVSLMGLAKTESVVVMPASSESTANSQVIFYVPKHFIVIFQSETNRKMSQSINEPIQPLAEMFDRLKRFTG